MPCCGLAAHARGPAEGATTWLRHPATDVPSAPSSRACPRRSCHVHIEGTLSPSSSSSSRRATGSTFRTPRRRDAAAYDFDDLASFLAVYYEGMSVLLTERDFYDLAMAYFRKARSQNVVYAEISSTRRRTPRAGSRSPRSSTGIRRAQQRRRGVARAAHPADHVLPARPQAGVGDGDARAVAALRRLDRRRRPRLRRARQPAREVQGRLRPGAASRATGSRCTATSTSRTRSRTSGSASTRSGSSGSTTASTRWRTTASSRR